MSFADGTLLGIFRTRFGSYLQSHAMITEKQVEQSRQIAPYEFPYTNQVMHFIAILTLIPFARDNVGTP
jgi:hypothetical protein